MSQFLCAAKPGYDWPAKLAKLDGVKYAATRERLRSIRDKLPLSNVDEKALKDVHFWEPQMMDEDEVDAWNDIGVELTMARIKGLNSNSAKLHEIVYQISVANVGIMQVQLVDVLEDCCTYELQKWLDRGWRILAVCPPNDARRPTYVVGHTEREGHR